MKNCPESWQSPGEHFVTPYTWTILHSAWHHSSFLWWQTVQRNQRHYMKREELAQVCRQEDKPSSDALWVCVVVCMLHSLIWTSILPKIHQSTNSHFDTAHYEHPTTHVIHFQVVMSNQQFSQVALSRNNHWMLHINWHICLSDTSTNTNQTILVYKRIQFVQRTRLSYR